MALEKSTSSLDTAMAKQSAINSVIQYGKDGLGKLKSGISSTIAKAGLVSILTFGAGEAMGQTNDIAKAPVKNPIGQVDKKGEGEEPIKDSVEYKKKRAELLKEWNRVLKESEENEKRSEQIEMLEGPITFFNRIEEQQGGVVTERDGKYARAGIAIINKTERLPELQNLVIGSKKILEYIVSKAPQPVVTKN